MADFTVIDAEQRSPEWFAARAGLVTGSKASDILAKGKTKGSEAITRRDYRLQLAAELLTGIAQDDGTGFVNAAMQWGIENEPFARMAYEAHTGNLVRKTGFIRHNDMLAGCSLDGDVDDFAGIIEIKCPKTATHLSYIEAGGVPTTYWPQIVHNLMVTGAQWCDFISFDPRLPENARLYVRRVTREDADHQDAYIAMSDYQRELRLFLGEVQATSERIAKYVA